MPTSLRPIMHFERPPGYFLLIANCSSCGSVWKLPDIPEAEVQETLDLLFSEKGWRLVVRFWRNHPWPSPSLTGPLLFCPKCKEK